MVRLESVTLCFSIVHFIPESSAMVCWIPCYENVSLLLLLPSQSVPQRLWLLSGQRQCFGCLKRVVVSSLSLL